ncbi:MAG: hypothetical protein ACOY0T_41125, partial [Myxococcota bacterium]
MGVAPASLRLRIQPNQVVEQARVLVVAPSVNRSYFALKPRPLRDSVAWSTHVERGSGRVDLQCWPWAVS